MASLLARFLRGMLFFGLAKTKLGRMFAVKAASVAKGHLEK
jgi:hypothetical protein